MKDDVVILRVQPDGVKLEFVKSAIAAVTTDDRAPSIAIGGIDDARKTCTMSKGWSGPRPGLIARYESGNLSRLPDNLEQRVASGRFHTASVGACEPTSGSQGFVRFRVAILLY